MDLNHIYELYTATASWRISPVYMILSSNAPVSEYGIITVTMKNKLVWYISHIKPEQRHVANILLTIFSNVLNINF